MAERSKSAPFGVQVGRVSEQERERLESHLND